MFGVVSEGPMQAAEARNAAVVLASDEPCKLWYQLAKYVVPIWEIVARIAVKGNKQLFSDWIWTLQEELYLWYHKPVYNIMARELIGF